MDDTVQSTLAVERTRLALERTYLSWIRTVIALMASGFAIDQLVENLREQRHLTKEALIEQAHITGLVLTTTGNILIALVTLYYIKRSRELAHMQPTPDHKLLPGIILSGVIFLAGLVLIYLVAIS